MAYILFQVLGAFIAGLILLFFTNNAVAKMGTVEHCYDCLYDPATGICTHTGTPFFPCPPGGGQILNVDYYSKHFILEAILQEIFGTFVTVLFFMMMTDESMMFSREKAINCFIIASGYISARAIFNGTSNVFITNRISTLGACLNPAISLGIFFASLCNGVYGWDAFSAIWIYPVMPFAGSILALLFYEFVYKKT